VAPSLPHGPPLPVCRISWSRGRVLDGDTIEALHNNHPERIRLNGIDCPEKVQAYRKHAQEGRP
jgi:endonuclease YncB( thermonuclease family)